MPVFCMKRPLFWIFGLLLLSPTYSYAADIVVPNEQIIPALERISWSAIIAGLVVALAAHMVISTLGIGIGAAAIDPYNREHPTTGVPTGMMIWMFVSGLISLFLGGWVAGRLAGTAPFDSTIHGVITWSLATVAMFLLATSSIGFIAGGTFRLLGQGASSVAKAAATIVPEAAKLTKDAVSEAVPAFDWKEIEQEAKKMLQSKDVMNSDQEIGDLLSKTYGIARDGLKPTDRETLVNVITSKTGQSKDEATQTIEKWEKMYRVSSQKYQEVVKQAEQSARKAADTATTVISHVACWTFASLVFGALVAGIGGNLGSTYLRL